MNRKEILTKLKTLRFCVFWPGSWDDIGFTERPIWINSLGFGYYSDDEPCNFIAIKNISNRDIRDLKCKINAQEVSVDEIKKTPFGAMITFDDDFRNIIHDFLFLPDSVNGCVFCGEDFDGWNFFASEEELIEAFDKQDNFWGGTAWEEMDGETLKLWYNRIFGEEELDFLLPMTISITS